MLFLIMINPCASFLCVQVEIQKQNKYIYQAIKNLTTPVYRIYANFVDFVLVLVTTMYIATNNYF